MCSRSNGLVQVTGEMCAEAHDDARLQGSRRGAQSPSEVHGKGRAAKLHEGIFANSEQHLDKQFKEKRQNCIIQEALAHVQQVCRRSREIRTVCEEQLGGLIAALRAQVMDSSVHQPRGTTTEEKVPKSS